MSSELTHRATTLGASLNTPAIDAAAVTVRNLAERTSYYASCAWVANDQRDYPDCSNEVAGSTEGASCCVSRSRAPTISRASCASPPLSSIELPLQGAGGFCASATPIGS